MLLYMHVSGEYQWEFLSVWEVGWGFGDVKMRLSLMLVAICHRERERSTSCDSEDRNGRSIIDREREREDLVFFGSARRPSFEASFIIEAECLLDTVVSLPPPVSGSPQGSRMRRLVRDRAFWPGFRYFLKK